MQVNAFRSFAIMKERNPNTQIVLFTSEQMPDILLDNMIAPIKDKGISYDVIKIPQGVAYNAFEWIIPTAVATFLLKPFFESFLKEAGKDTYLLFKEWIKNTAINSRSIEVKLITSKQSTEKLNKSYTQSLSYSAAFQTKGGKLIKVLFDDTLDDEFWVMAIEKMFDNISDHYENYPNDKISKAIEISSERVNDVIYALIDIDSEEWVYMNDRALLNMARKFNNK